ncbi:MAG: extracellular solute-binding protein [Rhodobacteraceae bacterium]|nr:extracellular solute-binding protein [Paracoccaceae bacterium]
MPASFFLEVKLTNRLKEKDDLTDHEVLRIVRFLTRTRTPFNELVRGGPGDPTWNLTSFLVTSYLKGEPVTISMLIDAADVPYGTAQRRIHMMVENGEITKVARSTTGKSFYLQPSPEMYSAFMDYIKQVKSLLAETVGLRGVEDANEFYFGGADFAREIMPPPPLQSQLAESGQELKFLLHHDNYFSAMRNMWADYRNNLGSRKSFSLYNLPDLRDQLRAELSKSRSDFDVVTLNMPWLGEFADTRLLMPLDEFIEDNNIRAMDFHPTVWSAGTWGTQQYGIPIYVTIESMAVRKDLFSESELGYPRTFDQVIDVGRHFHDPSRGFSGVAWNAARGMPIASSFMILMGCCGAPILNIPRARRYHNWAALSGEHFRPKINSEEGRVVLDYMHRLVEISPPDILEMDWNRRIKAFLEGEVAMAYCWSMRAARFEYDMGSMVRRRTELIPQPKGPMGMSANPAGGFLLSIPANLPKSRAKLAFDAIAWLASPEAMKKHVTNGLPVAPRFSVAADPEVAAASPIVRFVDRLSQRGMLCSWQRPPIPEYGTIEEILGSRIHDALSGALTDGEALSQAQDEIDHVMHSNGRY